LKEGSPDPWQIIEALRALQEIDDEVRSVAEERGRLRGRLDGLHEALERGEEDLGSRRRKIADAEEWYRDQQEKLRADHEKVAKLKAQLGQVTKSKEYMAIQRELEMLRQQINDKEDELQRFTEALESHKAAVADEEEKLCELRREADGEEKATAQSLKDFDGRIDETEEKRRKWTVRIPADVLRRYERVKSRRNGLAIVQVVDGRCSGCHMTVPPQLLNVLQRRDSLEICPSCNRYIYMTEQEEAEAAEG